MGMTQENAALLRQAQQAIREGDKQHARQLLQQALHWDRDNYTAWLLLASVTHDPRTALEYVQQAAQLNPTSATTQKALAWAEDRARAIQPPTPTDVPPPPVTPNKWRRWLWPGLTAAVVFVLILFAALWWSLGSDTDHATVSMAAADAAPLFSVTPSTTETAVPQLATTPSPAPSQTPTPAPHIVAKNINHSKDGGDRDPRPTWTLTPSPTPTPTPTNTPMPTFLAPQSGPVSRPFGVGPNERWVDVNLTTQALVAYEGDTAVLTTRISSGTWEFPTVTGQFRIYLAYRSQTMDGRRLGYDYYLENVPYVMYFYKDYALHGTFWHNNFGTPMSHGCVNMKTTDAGWLYEWASIGTMVNVHY